MGKVIFIDGDPVNQVADLWQYTATNYTELTTVVAPVALEGELAIVYETQGVWLINRKEAGIYVYLSGTWVYFTQELKDEIQINVADIASILSQLPDNVVTYKTMSDLPTLVGGKVPLAGGTFYNCGVPFFSLTAPLNPDNITGLTTFSGNNNIISYSGTGTMCQGSMTSGLIMGDFLMLGTGTEKIWDLVGNGDQASNLLILDKITFNGFSGKGIIDNVGATNHGNTQYANCGTSLVVKDPPVLDMTVSPFINLVDSKSPSIILDGTLGNITIAGSALTTQLLESVVQVSKNVTVTGRVSIKDNNFSDALGGELLASAKGNTGVVLSDNGSGKLRVTSVAHGLTEERVVGITNAVSPGHNGDHNVLAVIDLDIFDLDVAFVAPDTGDWTTGNSNDFRDAILWNVEDNGNELDSSEEFVMELVNSVTVTIPAAFTIVEVQGIANDWIELEARRFGFELDGFGRIRVIHPKKRTYATHGIFTAEPVSGGVQLIACYIMINSVPVAHSVFEQATNRPVGFSPFLQAIEPSVGDYFSIGVENQDGSTDIIVYSGTLNGI